MLRFFFLRPFFRFRFDWQDVWNTQHRVWPHFEIPQRSSKILPYGSHFKLFSLDMWSKTVFRVLCFLSLKSHSSSCALEHKAPTSFCRSRSLAALLASCQVMLMVFDSVYRVLFYVGHGLSLPSFPCGFQFDAWWVILVCSRRMVWPIHLHFLVWKVSVMDFWPDSSPPFLLRDALWPSDA